MPSPIDELYRQLFGKIPQKDGEAYERIAAAVCKLFTEDLEVFHDQRLRGMISKSLYQIDVLVQAGETSSFGEAKDYSDSNRKVGRPDLQKLGGALPDVNVEAGVFFSATDYTKPARQYANSATEIVGKPIVLMHLRPSTEADEMGRLKRIVLELKVRTPDYNRSSFNCVLTDESNAYIKQKHGLKTGERLPVSADRLYLENGSPAISIAELTARGFGNSHTDVAEGCFVLTGYAVKMGEELVSIKGIQYCVRFEEIQQEIHITTDAKALLLLKTDDGTTNKLILDKDLRRVQFSMTGEVSLREQS